jgi:hypothetical protein
MAHPKKMLEAILTKAELKPHEREMYEDIWDRVHRYGKATWKQKVMIEKVYYGQKLGEDKKPAVQKKGPVATVSYKGVDKEVCVTTLEQLSQVCPGIKPGSKQHAKIAEFFRKGGQALKVVPVES